MRIELKTDDVVSGTVNEALELLHRHLLLVAIQESDAVAGIPERRSQISEPRFGSML